MPLLLVSGTFVRFQAGNHVVNNYLDLFFKRFVKLIFHCSQLKMNSTL